jgi:hypothetical protein
MKLAKKSIIVITVTGVLTGSALAIGRCGQRQTL